MWSQMRVLKGSPLSKGVGSAPQPVQTITSRFVRQRLGSTLGVRTLPLLQFQSQFATSKEQDKAKALKEKEKALKLKEKEKALKLQEKEKALKMKEKEKIAKEKERAKIAKEKERERAKVLNEKEKEKVAKEKDREKEKEKAIKEKEKERAVKEKEKEKAAKEKEKERVSKEKEKEKAAREKEKEKQKKEKEKEREQARLRKELEEAKPARVLSPMNFFYKDKFQAEAKSGDSAPAVLKRLASQWKNLSEAEKRPYQEKSAQDKKRKEKQMEEYQKTLPPKRPLNAYMLFANKQRAQITKANPNASVADVARLTGEQWKSLPEQEKQGFFDQAQKAKVAFEAKSE